MTSSTADIVKNLRDEQTIAETLPRWSCDRLQATMHAAADRIEALEGELTALRADHESARVTWAECMRSWINRATRAERLRAALEAIAVRAGTFEGSGSYIAYVELAGEIEKMADAARNGEEP